MHPQPTGVGVRRLAQDAQAARPPPPLQPQLLQQPATGPRMDPVRGVPGTRAHPEPQDAGRLDQSPRSQAGQAMAGLTPAQHWLYILSHRRVFSKDP